MYLKAENSLHTQVLNIGEGLIKHGHFGLQFLNLLINPLGELQGELLGEYQGNLLGRVCNSGPGQIHEMHGSWGFLYHITVKTGTPGHSNI